MALKLFKLRSATIVEKPAKTSAAITAILYSNVNADVPVTGHVKDKLAHIFWIMTKKTSIRDQEIVLRSTWNRVSKVTTIPELACMSR